MVPEWLDLSAVVVGAFAGVLVGQKHKLDLVGFIAMCIICALGGGLMRDFIMQKGSVYALESYWAIPACVATALVGFCFPTILSRHPNLYDLVDIVSVALFVVAGTSKAIANDLHASSVVLMGTITGVGGGMLRDVFLGEVPRVFRKSNFYALCAVVGSVAYYACMQVRDIGVTIAPFVTVFVVVLLRQLSLHFNIESPADVDLEPKVVNTGKRVMRKVHRQRSKKR